MVYSRPNGDQAYIRYSVTLQFDTVLPADVTRGAMDVTFKIAVLVFQCLTGQAPAYLA